MSIEELLAELPELPPKALEILSEVRADRRVLVQKLRDVLAEEFLQGTGQKDHLNLRAQNEIADQVLRMACDLFDLIGLAYGAAVQKTSNKYAAADHVQPILHEVKERLREFAVEEWESVIDGFHLERGVELIGDDEIQSPEPCWFKLILDHHLKYPLQRIVSRIWQDVTQINGQGAAPATHGPEIGLEADASPPPTGNGTGAAAAVAARTQVNGKAEDTEVPTPSAPRMVYAGRGRPATVDHRQIADVVEPYGPNWKEHLEAVCQALDLAAARHPNTNNWADTWAATLKSRPDVVSKAIQFSLESAKKC